MMKAVVSAPTPDSTRELSTRVLDTRMPTTRPVAPAPEPLPARIDRFVPLEELGRGGMGVVYRARDPRLDRIVALKLLRRHRGELAAQERMRREAQAMAQLSHPNVVQVFDAGIFEGQVFIAMELVAGRTLRAWQRQRRRPLEEVLDAYAQAGTGLAAAHDGGLVHRDFKPDNVLMGDDGRVRVLDFGLVLAQPSDSERDDFDEATTGATTAVRPPGTPVEPRLTASGALMGTPAYMAPEQHEGKPASPASDQFAFCVSLYEAVYGERPFEGVRLLDLVGRVLRGELRPEPAGSAVPSWLRRILLRGLATEPSARWPSMDALLGALRDGARPRTARRWLPALGVVIGVAAYLALDSPAPASTRCPDAQGELAGIWDPPRRDALRSAVLGTDLPHAAGVWDRLAATLDAHADRWARAHRSACEDSSAGPRDRRLACLGERLEGLAALVELLEDPSPTTLDRALVSAATLPDVDQCLDEDPLATLPAPQDETEADAIRAARGQLARISIHRRAGLFDEAAKRARLVLEQAEALGHAPLVAEAALQSGNAHYSTGDPEAARRDLERAFFVATELGYDRIAGEAASRLVLVTGVGLSQLDEASRWAEHALAAAPGQEGLAQAFALANLAQVVEEQGQLDEARDYLERAIEIEDRLLEPEALHRASTFNRLGMVLRQQGQAEEALALHERSLAVQEHALGPNHPHVAGTLNYRAIALVDLGEVDRALVDYRRVLAIWERTLEPGHPDMGVVLTNIGVALVRDGRPREAVEHYRRALAIWTAALGPEHLRIAALNLNLGNALSEIGEHEEAVAAYRRLLEIREALLGPDHPKTVEARDTLDVELDRP